MTLRFPRRQTRCIRPLLIVPRAVRLLLLPLLPLPPWREQMLGVAVCPLLPRRRLGGLLRGVRVHR